MITLAHDSSADIVVRGPNAALDGSFIVEAIPRIANATGGVDSDRTDDDIVFHDVGGSTGVDRVRDLVITSVSDGFFSEASPTFSSLDPSVATIDHMGLTTRVSDGYARLRVQFGLMYLRQFSVQIARTIGDPVTTTFKEFVTGSLARHMCDQIDARIAGKTFAANGDVYSSKAPWVRSTGFWAADVDLTCASPWNNAMGENRAGTLVTPRHALVARHYGTYSPGEVYTFVTMGNVAHQMTVDSVYVCPSSDTTILRFSTDAPAGITFAKVMPYSTLIVKAPSMTRGYSDPGAVPGLVLNQTERGSVSDFYPNIATTTMGVNGRPTAVEARSDFWNGPVVGDSGNPVFLLVNGQPVLLTTWTSGGFGGGPNYVTQAVQDEINTGLTTLGGGYQLTTADLSGFPSY